MFFQPIFLISKHPIEWETCLEVVASYLEAHAIQLHHMTTTTACLEVVTLTYPSEQADWQAIAAMLEQDFMTAISIVIGKPEFEQTSWEQQKQLILLAQANQQAIIHFEQLIVDSLACEQTRKILQPLADKLTPEHIETIRALCATNINLSQAAKHLYLHRNTLNYRIEKLLQVTGLDVRTFYGAMTLYATINLKH